MEKKNTRRNFIKSSAITAGAFMIVPRHVLGRGHVPPSDKVNLAFAGAGGRGGSLIKAMKSENIVALCDVDEERAKRSFNKYPDAKRYKDFRRMLEQKDIDAVVVATPDHTHAVIALPAMELGKHVYVEKPLTHNIFEARQLTEMARKQKLVTQMGNHGASGKGVRQLMEIMATGIIGKVTRVHAWTNRPIWPQGVAAPTGQHEIPATLDWDLWQGPARATDYHPNYLPFKWRGWWAYGTGALGDMGCHILDPVFRALDLKYPVAAEASCSQVYSGDFYEADYDESCPPASKVHIYFPERTDGEGGELPAVEVIWYDGGLMPPLPAELGPDEPMGNWDGGVLFEGTKGKLMCDCYGSNPRLLPSKMHGYFKMPEPSLPRVEEGHQMSWINAIKQNTPETPSSNFNYAGPFTEMVLMGNLAVRCYNLKKLKVGKKPGSWAPYKYPGRLKLKWDGENMRITNFDEANQFVKRAYRQGW
ncbi:MAG: Gfo/Idh/MocA family oxidoreductase [Bacteroidota bacterium]